MSSFDRTLHEFEKAYIESVYEDMIKHSPDLSLIEKEKLLQDLKRYVNI